MRVNMPVTGKEYILRDDHMIVSKTDSRGIITYINKDFLEVSGFTEEELIGAPHNIVRHPDMPPEAFKDLWDTLQAGMPWTAMVKNRCKNGDHYWVVANATPIWEGGQVVGYMSVRSKPTPQQVEAATRIYASIKAGEKTWNVVHGRVEKNTLLGKINMFKNISIKGRLASMIGLASVLLLLVGGIGLYGLSGSNDNLDEMYRSYMRPVKDLSEINTLMLRNRTLILNVLAEPTESNIRDALEKFAQNKTTIDKDWEEYLKSVTDPEEKKLAEDFGDKRGKYVEEGLKPAAAAIKAGNLQEARAVAIGPLRQHYLASDAAVNELIGLQFKGADNIYLAAVERYKSIRLFSISAIVIGIALAVWMGFLIIRAITRPLGRAVEVFNSISGGKYDNEITVQHEDEVGKVLNALRSMQTKLGFDVAETKRVADENLRIKIGLDNVSTGVMIADSSRKIIYAN